MSFKSYSFSPEIMSQIEAKGYHKPTPIQEKAIPVVLEGHDVMGLAQTGTGKTAAFALPMLQRLLPGKNGTLRGLIIAPTRELAEQINETIVAFSGKIGLRSLTVYGGVGMNPQVRALERGVDIVVACPGRLLDHIRQRTINLSKIEVLVLDEADHMFDMGFLPNIKEIIRFLPTQKQTLFFSATMPPDIRSLANAMLRNPTLIEINHAKPLDAITHTLFPVDTHLKTKLLLAILKSTRTQSVLIFTKTKHRAKSLDSKLQKMGFKAASLQGNLSQNRRQAALDGFRDGTFDVMVATDIAARGIDVSRVSHVINYDLPDTFEAYTHRTGRTGRAERTGDAFNLVSSEDSEMLRIIERKLGSPLHSRILEGFDYAAPRVVGESEFIRPPRPPRYKSGNSSSPSGRGRSGDGTGNKRHGGSANHSGQKRSEQKRPGSSY